MTWTNTFENELYCVKRKYAEEYHTGSYSYVMPKMYKIGNAKSVCKNLNKFNDKEDYDNPLSYEEWLGDRKSTDSDMNKKYYQNYLDNMAKGPWVVAVVQFSASEISNG